MNLNEVNSKLTKIKSLLEVKDDSSWMSLKAACEFTGLSASTLRRAVKDGKLRCSRMTGKILFRRRWLNRFLGE